MGGVLRLTDLLYFTPSLLFVLCMGPVKGIVIGIAEYGSREAMCAVEIVY